MTSRSFWWNEIKDLIARIKMHILKAKLPFYPPCEVKCRLQNGVSTTITINARLPWSLKFNRLKREFFFWVAFFMELNQLGCYSRGKAKTNSSFPRSTQLNGMSFSYPNSHNWFSTNLMNSHKTSHMLYILTKNLLNEPKNNSHHMPIHIYSLPIKDK